MMHRIVVDEKKWIDEPRFLHALNFSMLTPGPEAQKLATYIGWLLHGVRGGLTAGILFVLPGALVMLGLSLLYALGRGYTVIDGALVRHQGGRAGDRRRGADPHRQARAQDIAAARHRRSGLRRHLLLGPAVSDDRHRRGADRLPGRAVVAGLARPQGRRRRADAARARPLAAGRDCRGGRPRRLVGAGRARGRDVRPEPRAGQRRHVLLEARRRQLRRRLRAAGLHGAAGGRDPSLDDRARNGRRPRPRGNHAGTADPGDAVRRLPRGLPRRRAVLAGRSPASSPPR